LTGYIAALGLKVDKRRVKDYRQRISTPEKSKLAAITGTNNGDQDLSSFATTATLVLKKGR
jgi:hypothetical protein